MKIKNYLDTKQIKILGFNIGLVVIELVYLLFRFSHIKKMVPFWYTKPWGSQQLATKSHLFLLILISFLIIAASIAIIIYMKTKYYRHGEEIILFLCSLANILLAFSFFKIVKVSSTPFEPLIDPIYLTLVKPVFISFIIVYLITPKILGLLTSKGVVTDPEVHDHPGMLLKKPSARGGGIIFVIGFVVAALFLTNLSKTTIGLMASMMFAGILGLIDDIQNTKSSNVLRKLENPFLRFGLQILIILPLIIAGTQIKFISNPINGILFLDTWQFSIGNLVIYPIAIIFTIVWILWIINLLSWSNGVDGQYSGVISIAAIVIAIIAMRETPLSPEIKNLTNIAGIVAGASLGLLPYTWHPSKIMWGFGAIAAGISIATLSILTKAKIATAIIVILVPFLDGLVTIIRRVSQKKNPLKGDRGHLHHLLINRGWGIKTVAIFYWVTTAVSGYIGIKSADKDPIQTVLTLTGLSAFFIVLLNIKSKTKTD